MDIMQALARVEQRLAALLAPPAGPLVPITVGDTVVGRTHPDRAARLARFDGVFVASPGALSFAEGLATAAARSAALLPVTAQLAREGALSAWRDELYAVAPSLGATPWFEIERAAARYFGVHTHAAHVNGLVRDEDTSMWIARRSPHKAIDPGMLDNLVGGGIASGATVAQTVVKESWEEAGIAPEIARNARLAGTLTVLREGRDGLQHETIHAHELWLPSDFVPASQDGEAVEHRRVRIVDLPPLLATGEMTVDATLVALDCLRRLER